MGAYKYIQKTIQTERKERSDVYRGRIAAWRKENTITKVERPTNLPRARTLGYKAKQGYIIVRVKVKRGRRKRPKPKGGRHEKHNFRFISPGASHQAMCEQKANRKYPNMEVLNSYWIGEDGQYKFYEVILADPSKKGVTTKAVGRFGRAFRGLTSAGKKARKRLKSRKTSDKKKRRGLDLMD